ncbi:MAG TPA: hypothetical protein VK891_00815 [Euzebyales bacterium]|nr:hypothetical protein [Euzebyales bacterium]
MHLDVVAFRAAHDLGLAAWFGGAYMGAIALNGASREVDDHTQRTRVANAGWFRWAAVVPVAIGSHLLGATALTRRLGCQGEPTLLSDVRAAVTLAAMLATVESGRSGRQVVKHGDVPVATAVQPISETPEPVARAQRRLRVVQWLIPALTAALLVIDAAQQDVDGGTRLLPRALCRGTRQRGRLPLTLHRRGPR